MPSILAIAYASNWGQSIYTEVQSKWTYSSECSSDNACSKEESEPPLEFVPFVVHRDQVDTAYMVSVNSGSQVVCIPGNSPASKKPSRIRIATSPPNVAISPIPIVERPDDVSLRR
jgi:hypothetical protein